MNKSKLIDLNVKRLKVRWHFVIWDSFGKALDIHHLISIPGLSSQPPTRIKSSPTTIFVLEFMLFTLPLIFPPPTQEAVEVRMEIWVEW